MNGLAWHLTQQNGPRGGGLTIPLYFHPKKQSSKLVQRASRWNLIGILRIDEWMDGWMDWSLIGDCAVVGGLTLKHAWEGEREREPHKDVLVISFATKRVCAERGGGRAMALLQLCRVHIPVCNSTNSPVALLLDNNGANNSSQSAHLTAFSNSAACYHHGVDVRLFASSSSSNRRGAAAGSLLQVLFFLSPPQNCSA